MNDFIEKWNTDSRFKTKAKLGLYTLFVVVVSIFAFSSGGDASTDSLDNDSANKTTGNSPMIEIPAEYNYMINIKINEQNYQYSGNKESKKETITKTTNGIQTNYVYQNGNFFQDYEGISNIVAKEQIYDVISYNYLNLENINKYLSISTKEEDNYLVYIKDIILGSDSQEYIVIKVDKNKTNIDYTSLMKLFDKSIESCMVEVIINENE